MTTPAEIAALPSARLIAPLNAARGGNASPGVQPGTSNEIVLAQYVVVFGTSGGVFVYVGQPGPGNPPVYWFGNVTQDPYKNALNQGIWAGQPGSVQVGIQTSGAGPTGDAQIFFVPVGSYLADATVAMAQTGGQAILELISAATAAGAQSDRAALFLGDHGAGTSAFLQGAYYDSSGTGHPLMTGTYAGLGIPAGSITAVDPSTGTGPGTPFAPETWHDISVDAGWGSLGEPPQYQMLGTTGFVALRGDISHAGTTVQAAINSGSPLPAAYRPGATRYYRTPQAADGAGAIQVDSSGVLTMRASGFSATQAILDGNYSI